MIVRQLQRFPNANLSSWASFLVVGVARSWARRTVQHDLSEDPPASRAPRLRLRAGPKQALARWFETSLDDFDIQQALPPDDCRGAALARDTL